MAPKGKGGAGQKTAQEPVKAMRGEGLTEAQIRTRLREAGYKTGRISQLLRDTRPVEADASTVVDLKTDTEMAENPVEKKAIVEVAPEPLAPVALPGAPAEVDFRTVADENEAQALLERHGAAVREHFRPQWIAGDGNCFYRAVARQLPEGEEHHTLHCDARASRTLCKWTTGCATQILLQERIRTKN
eukprot:Skav203735  [mRNA]  locus=scaffold68:195340:196140:+ [translate_table: standard]